MERTGARATARGLLCNARAGAFDVSFKSAPRRLAQVTPRAFKFLRRNYNIRSAPGLVAHKSRFLPNAAVAAPSPLPTHNRGRAAHVGRAQTRNARVTRTRHGIIVL